MPSQRPGRPHPTADAPPPLDIRHLRDCLSEFATGVTIVTAALEDGVKAGLTVNSFNALSLEPPLVLWSLSLRSASLAVFSHASHFAINVLSVRQVDLARRFSRAGPNRFDGLELHHGLGGAPLIDGANAWFECENSSRQAAGDHMLFIGLVRRCSREHGADPLIFRHGRFAASRQHPDQTD